MKKSMVDVAYDLMSTKKKAIVFLKLWEEVCQVMAFTKQQEEDNIAQFYSDLSLDDRFVNVGENKWDLRDRKAENATPIMKLLWIRKKSLSMRRLTMTTRKTMLQKQGMKNSKKDASPFFMPLSRYQHVLWKHSSILLLENQGRKAVNLRMPAMAAVI